MDSHNEWLLLIDQERREHARIIMQIAVMSAHSDALGLDLDAFVAEQTCALCGASEPDDEVQSASVWIPWGLSALDLAYCRSDTAIWLCNECDQEAHRSCEHCGAVIPIEYAGLGYLDNDQVDKDDPHYPEEILCPECADESPDHTLLVRIAQPPEYI
jgi:hypothetical protein